MDVKGKIMLCVHLEVNKFHIGSTISIVPDFDTGFIPAVYTFKCGTSCQD